MQKNNELLRLEDCIKVSIDRLTIVADYREESLDSDMREWLKLPFIEIVNDGLQVVDDSRCYVDDFGHQHGYVAPEQVAYINSPRFMKNVIRIDFNPNHGMTSKGGRWLLDLIAKLRNKHFSRCDVAFDIFNQPVVEKYQVWRFGVSKKVIFGRDGSMETTYYGSPNSERQIRQYNKKVEQEARHGKLVNLESWWRIELQLRGRKVKEYPSIVREMLEDFYLPNYKSLANPSQQAMMLSMMVDPTIYASASSKTKQRWRAMMKDCWHTNDISVAMANVFVENFYRLENELQTIMNKFQILAEEADFLRGETLKKSKSI